MAKPPTGPLSAWTGKMRTRRQLRRLAPLLVAGRYRLYSNLAVRMAGTDLPAHQQALVRDNRVNGLGATLAETLPPRYARLAQGGQAIDTPADGLLLRSDWLLLPSADGRFMLRLSERAEHARQLLANARWLAAAYPCPAVDAVDTGVAGLHGVREAFVAGTPIRDVDPTTADTAYRQLLACCADHAARCEGRFDHAAALAELDRWPLPDWLAHALASQRAAITEVLADAPLLHCHGDCHNANVLVRDDGSVCLIDLQRVQALPFFFDALSLPRGSGANNRHLRRRLLAGDYDNELARVWQAAGRSFQPAAGPAMLLAMAVAHACRPQYAGKDPGRRRDKFVQAVEKFRADCGL